VREKKKSDIHKHEEREPIIIRIKYKQPRKNSIFRFFEEKKENCGFGVYIDNFFIEDEGVEIVYSKLSIYFFLHFMNHFFLIGKNNNGFLFVCLI